MSETEMVFFLRAHDNIRSGTLKVFFELSSAQNELKRGGTDEQQLGRCSTAVHEKDHRELGSRELALPPHEQIEAEMGLEGLHDVEVDRGELQAWQHDVERWRNVGLAQPSPTDTRRSGQFQAVPRPAVGRGWSEDPCRRGGRPDLALTGDGSCGGNGFRGKKVREERKEKERKEKEKKRERKRKRKKGKKNRFGFISGLVLI